MKQIYYGRICAENNAVGARNLLLRLKSGSAAKNAARLWRTSKIFGAAAEVSRLLRVLRMFCGAKQLET